MDKSVSITIKASNGKTYPCRVTLGAMRRFKQETGKDADNISGASDLAVFVWCCCFSACKADGVEFGESLEDFCDLVDMGALSEFTKAIAPAEKKTAK
ncbi:MAG: hypothetical protein IJ604_08805 [Prevotella sp.]|nr:hypothetical protein [Prevotella sp.]